MLETIRSGAKETNPQFQELPRKSLPGRALGNLAWFQQAVSQRPEGRVMIVLVGGRSTTDLRLRMAQSDAREDLLPSDWSHALALLDGGADRNDPVVEIPLSESSVIGFPPHDNGVVTGKLAQYADRGRYPNLAVLFIPAPQAQFVEAVERFKRLRAEIDAVELKARWLPYLWGVGASTNPLHEGMGIPSAAFIEAVAAANQFELTPGLASRSSCPEAIWQAARWWHEYHRESSVGPSRPIEGFYTFEHHLS